MQPCYHNGCSLYYATRVMIPKLISKQSVLLLCSDKMGTILQSGRGFKVSITLHAL